MFLRILIGVVLLGSLCGCAARPSSSREAGAPATSLVRFGPERLELAYEDAYADDKRALFLRINEDRAAHGVAPLRYEPRAALVGDRLCLDSVARRFFGHWDLDGRAPYVRWGLAGGVDFHSQNVATFSRSRGALGHSVRELLLSSHEQMMAERPPDDGHRRAILDPEFTHVGIGVAAVGGEFRMSQEFTRSAFEWIELPARALRAGQVAEFAGQPLPGWEVGFVEVRHEVTPRPLSVAEVGRRGSYAYPRVVRSLQRRLPEGVTYVGGGAGDFVTAPGGRVSFRFSLDSGPGYYFVLCYLRPVGREDVVMTPATAAMVTALP